jgi:hypothetical protein
MRPKLFISYRRDDSAGYSGRVHDRLRREFGGNLLFMDVDSIPLGVNFSKVLVEEVAKCDTLIAVIGPDWLDARDEKGHRRLDKPDDFVRIEIGTALKRGIPVIPILLEGTRVPKADQLPDDLKELALRTGLNVRHDSFSEDMERLIRGLKGGQSQASTEADDIEGADSAIPLRKILVASGRADKRFAMEIRTLLQNAMKDYEVIGIWEDKCKLSQDLDEISVMFAVLTVFKGAKEVQDPPASQVRTALRLVGPEHRLVLLALDPRAQSWSQECLKALDPGNYVETEPFFGEDGNSLFEAILKGNPYVAAAIDFRISEIAEKLRGKLRAAFNQANSSSNPSVRSSPAHGPKTAGTVIVMGDPRGPSTGEVSKAIRELTANLIQLGIKFEAWPDGWRNIRQPRGLLFQDPIFVRTVAAVDTDTKRVAEDLEDSLRSAFDASGDLLPLLSTCRRILWRTVGPAWTLLDTNANPCRSTDDIDNLETRVSNPHEFAEWLARFVSPDAVIFHEGLGESRPPGLIRSLRDAVEECLSTSGQKPIIRLRSLDELASVGNNRLAIVAVDDLPLPRSIDFREKVRQRLDEYQYKLDNILRQLPENDRPPVLRVAMLVQDVGPDAQSELRVWKPLRVKGDEAMNFRVEQTDMLGLRQATEGLIN